MRRPVLITAVIAASLLLAACGDETEPESPDPSAPATADTADTAADAAALEGVTVEGALGAQPTLDFEMPFSVGAPVARVDTEGTGDVLVDGQTLEINYFMVDGEAGTQLASTWETGSSESMLMGDPSMIPELTAILVDQRVGVRILAALPATEATEVSPAQASTILVLEVVSARDVPTRAEGEPVEPPAGLPLVTLGETGEPSIEVPADATEPTELVAQPLITGAGPVVEEGQQISVHYSGWLWDGTQFDSSWVRGTPAQFAIGVGQVITGWDQGLVGQTVGSQLLLVIPAELGYGETGQGESIPPDATLIFVVDILDAS